MEDIKRTILIIGAGPGVGLSVAKKFGSEGFNVGLIARNTQKMDYMLKELKTLNINAKGFLADYYDKEALDKALDAAIDHFGFIDTVEMQFMKKNVATSNSNQDSLETRKLQSNAGVIGLESDEVLLWIESQIEPAMQIVNKLLPHMQEHRQNYVSGFICPMGWSGIWPAEAGNDAPNELPYHILRKLPPAIAFSTLIKYLEFLNAQMCYDNIYAVADMLALWVKPNTPTSPDAIAEDMYTRIFLPRQTDPLLRRKVIEVFPENVHRASDLIRY
ncbi:MAG: SDR family NAD(P)-dependent oxidoreductase [Peptococcaceae bacterium]|nr:SDR family NAD(P)-dependent oxidoreductase [Peptococcaceae bacterium]